VRKVMFSLVGEQTAPNLFLHLHFEPEVHYLIHSKKTEKHAESLAHALVIWAADNRKKKPEIPRVLLEDENNLIYVQNVMQKEIRSIDIDSEVILNITSGTKPMNLGVWETRQMHPRADVVYLDRDLVRHIETKGGKTESLSCEPSIRVFLRAYGYEIVNTTPLRSPFLSLLARTAEKIGMRPDLRARIAQGQAFPKAFFPEELVQKLVRAGFLLDKGNTLEYCEESQFHEKGLRAIENFWSGDWLSLLVWKIVKSALPDKEILVGTKVADVDGKKGTNEIDVLFFKDWTLWCVECKTGKQQKNEPYYKIKQVTRDLGGIFAVPVLATTGRVEKAYQDETVRHVVLGKDVYRFGEEITRIVRGG